MLNEHLLDVPAPEQTYPGVADVALVVRFPGLDEPVQMGVQTGVTPRAIWSGIEAMDEGYELVGVVRRWN